MIKLVNDDNDKNLRGAWKNSLRHQIASAQLQEYEIVKADLGILLWNFN